MESITTKGTIIITGANGGLGSAITKEIVSKPEFSAYHGLYLVRDAAHAPALDSVLRTSSKHSHEALSMDLTDLDSVRKAAEAINLQVSEGKIPQIRALILNAGFQDFGKQTWTKDGFDTTFSANYLGHWLLTLLLLKSIDRDAGRIVIVGSQAHE
jgi:NAD(P)-dependent dehydrogenase (short-subunit alcohol dehydrogenase family)